MKPCWIGIGIGAVLTAACAPAYAEDEAVDFNREIKPILSDRCFSCHGPDSETRDADYRLDIEEEAKADLGGYFGLVPGKAVDSEVWIRITHDDPDEKMPPAKSKKSLKPEEIALLKKWIDAGAPYAKHWSYEAPVKAKPRMDANQREWIRNEIDGYVLARLEKAGLKPSAEADPRTLMRRVSLDLTGLPPTPEQVAAFLDAWKADSEKAYEDWVDQLLKSNRFGERWARPWLDLARYADSNGFQADQLRDSWAYRDWVIEALNDNMPFDRFSIEQLAGDLLPNATLDQKIATGFHRTVTCNVEAGVHPEENRVNQVVDRVNTTNTVWLGSTLGCAQCHDHKYDPFTMKDYYATFAYFNNTPVEVQNPSGKGVSFDFYGPKMDLPMSEEKEAQFAALEKKLKDLKTRQTTVAAADKKERAAWEARLLASLDQAPEWKVLEIEEFRGREGETWEDLGDGSLLVTGMVPDKSTYTLSGWTKLDGIRAMKIETLTHDSLPANGPARGNGDKPNSIITELSLSAAAKGGKDEPVDLHGAISDFSQTNWGAGGAIDGDPKTGWAINPQFGKPHWLIVQCTEPVAADENGTQLTLTIDQNYGGGRVIGRIRVSVTTGDVGVQELPKDITAVLKKPAGKRSKAETKKLDDHYAKSSPKLQALDRQVRQTEQAMKKVEPDTTLVMVEMPEPRDTHVLMRGNYLSPEDSVEAAPPTTLHPFDPKLPPNRLGYAQWLMSRENPLVARVTVNRWWHEIFGRGIVTTIEDFGSQGESPTHPKLLDWLAVDFMDSGWDMQRILKRMVMSSTYRQSSRMTPELLEKDPENALLSRGPRFRMSAEMIRDNALAVSGLLSTKMGGKPVMPYQPAGLWRQVGRNEPKWVDAKDENRFRRGIYVVYRRAAPYPSFVNFDAPDRGACVVKRGRTNTPLQALTLLNDPAYVEMALALADRILTEKPEADFASRLDGAFEMVLQRSPSKMEAAHLKAVFDERLKSLDAKTAQEIVAEPGKIVKPAFAGPAEELAAWFYLANILLNLDETITKG